MNEKNVKLLFLSAFIALISMVAQSIYAMESRLKEKTTRITLVKEMTDYQHLPPLSRLALANAEDLNWMRKVLADMHTQFSATNACDVNEMRIRGGLTGLAGLAATAVGVSTGGIAATVPATVSIVTLYNQIQPRLQTQQLRRETINNIDGNIKKLDQYIIERTKSALTNLASGEWTGVMIQEIRNHIEGIPDDSEFDKASARRIIEEAIMRRKSDEELRRCCGCICMISTAGLVWYKFAPR
jgi:hypothetical protein